MQSSECKQKQSSECKQKPLIFHLWFAGYQLKETGYFYSYTTTDQRDQQCSDHAYA